jgi:hypothetical protein
MPSSPQETASTIDDAGACEKAGERLDDQGEAAG